MYFEFMISDEEANSGGIKGNVCMESGLTFMDVMLMIIISNWLTFTRCN